MNTLLFAALLALGLLAPGWLLGRALRTPAGALGSFIGSAAILLNLVLLLAQFNVALDRPHLATAITIVCLLLILVARFQRQSKEASPYSGMPAPGSSDRTWQWAAALVALGFAAIVVRATIEPLSGFDTVFRWDFLARQMLRLGNLDFYPPVTATDFNRYGWCDGIAPLVSSLYLWTYLAFGHIDSVASIPVVLTQAIMLYRVVFQLAASKGGSAAGWCAMALLSSCGLMLWAVAMGQETGLTALSLLAMFWFLECDAQKPEARYVCWAGLAAGVGALAREYGLAFVLIGWGMLLARRAPMRRTLEFLVTAVLVAAPWYVRNWVRTGNPLVSQGLGGLFPTNPVNDGYFAVVRDMIGLGTTAVSPHRVALLLIVVGGVSPIIAVIAAVRLRRGYVAWMGSMAIIVALWLWSIGQTSGGITYSLRVLTPALAIAAVVGGIGTALYASRRLRIFVLAVVSLASVDAAVRSLYLPIDPYVPWWELQPAAWHHQNKYGSWWNRHSSWTALKDAAERRSIIVDAPYEHAVLAQLGATPVPLASPAISYLFQPDATLDASIARLRADGVRFIVRSIGNNIVDEQLARVPFFRALHQRPPTAKFPTCHVYDLYAPELGGPPTPPASAAPR